MELTFGIILDELSIYNPIVLKNCSKSIKYKQFHIFNTSTTEIDPSFLYLVNSSNFPIDFSQIYPKSLIVIGNTTNEDCLNQADTYIQLAAAISLDDLLQIGFNIFKSYETWDHLMLLSIINSGSINKFLEIAAEKLTNPIALLDNNAIIIAKAGQFINSAKGTIWEKIETSGIILTDFFTAKEYREILAQDTDKSGKPCIGHPSVDKDHAYVSSYIWINNKQYGGIGLVGINAPFTDGQLDIIFHINENLKLYFKNNDIYMRMIENKEKYIDNLLEGADISREIVTYHLGKVNWKLNDDFCFFSFDCLIKSTSTVESISYVKLINRVFPLAQISVYQNSIIMIIRTSDYPVVQNKERQRLEQFLSANDIRCGISTIFKDFMQLQYYYVQSCFALEYCKTKADEFLSYYEDCYNKHILKSLAQSADLQCFCHPKILSLWNSDQEGQRELVRSLYQYLLNGRNISLTAETLHVHRNTFIYRLTKLSEILDNDLKTLSPDQTFFYLLSCMIVENL